MGELGRRTKARVIWQGKDISVDIGRFLKELTYTDNETGKTDDLQLVLADPEGLWLREWLNPGAGGSAKGSEVAAAIVQENWGPGGGDTLLDCGVFSVDSVEAGGPPSQITAKASSPPYPSGIRGTLKSKTWENTTLARVAADIASANGLALMYESDFSPAYGSREQIRQSDMSFLESLCRGAGISLKATSKMLVLFDAAKYERASSSAEITFGRTDYSGYSFSSNYAGCAYGKCHVAYTDPLTGRTVEATFAQPGAGATAQVLEVNEKVSAYAEALSLAEKRLREKNKGETQGSFELAGDTGLLAGLAVGVSGFGLFDGKYIIESAAHTVSGGGYRTGVKLRRALEGY